MRSLTRSWSAPNAHGQVGPPCGQSRCGAPRSGWGRCRSRARRSHRRGWSVRVGSWVVRFVGTVRRRGRGVAVRRGTGSTRTRIRRGPPRTPSSRRGRCRPRAPRDWVRVHRGCRTPNRRRHEDASAVATADPSRPGCLLGSEVRTCPRTRPGDRPWFVAVVVTRMGSRVLVVVVG